jgi:EAL domain-containing protein (putative c-di-GMP-specific phosphodiesterase class I)
VSNAEAAMHESKAAGGDRYEVFSQAMRRQIVDRMTTESSLHRALDRGELALFYQPVVAIDGEPEVVAVEALLRWWHPERGLVGPDQFIPVAEVSGLIIPIGGWVLEEAGRQLREWWADRSGRPASVEVNLSARQVDHPSLLPTVERVLETTGLPPRAFTLELTESALMKDAVAAHHVLESLKALGVVLAIDDFGTGYSSLGYLQRFPLDILKVDKSFVDGLGHDHGTEIVAAVVNLAHALGLEVVAEGVETPAQLEALRELGCDFAQGYLFSRPMPPVDLRWEMAVA